MQDLADDVHDVILPAVRPRNMPRMGAHALCRKTGSGISPWYGNRVPSRSKTWSSGDAEERQWGQGARTAQSCHRRLCVRFT
jgi:hypothetical protein